MEDLSGIIASDQLPLEIPALPYLIDHRVNDRAVLPAVEAMELLSRAVQRYRPETDVAAMAGMQFDKFLYIDPDTGPPAAYCEIGVHGNGDVTARLATRTESKKASLARIKIHAAVMFPGQPPPLTDLPLDLACAPEGVCLSLPRARIYPELIPFGPSYRNLEVAHLTGAGATAEIRTPAVDEGGAQGSSGLGSPFALDAAFHAACLWAQRFAGIVAFPVAVDQRRIHGRTRPGESYFVHVRPARVDPVELSFDLRIYDRQGRLHEACGGVRMRDVSGGKLNPPAWIRPAPEGWEAGRIAEGCTGAALVELDSLAPFADQALSAAEALRFERLNGRRRKSFLAARLACKRLSRALSDPDNRTDPQRITTICAEGPRPCCPRLDGPGSHACSVAHDERFAVAVAADGRVGVDVEKPSARLWAAHALFMSPAEQALARQSPLGEIEAAVRIWSVKEAVAKALDLGLADAWQGVRVTAVGRTESGFRIAGEEPGRAAHAAIEGHVITRVVMKSS